MCSKHRNKIKVSRHPLFEAQKTIGPEYKKRTPSDF